jgi:hypothetical protein
MTGGVMRLSTRQFYFAFIPVVFLA